MSTLYSGKTSDGATLRFGKLSLDAAMRDGIVSAVKGQTVFFCNDVTKDAAMASLVNNSECPMGARHCRCHPLCAQCGFHKHAAIHQPVIGGSCNYVHDFVQPDTGEAR